MGCCRSGPADRARSPLGDAVLPGDADAVDERASAACRDAAPKASPSPEECEGAVASGGGEAAKASPAEAIRAAAGEALRACRAKLDLGDVTGAEEVLLAAMLPSKADAAEDGDAEFRRMVWSSLRSSPEYAETLREIASMEQLVEDVLSESRGDDIPWTLGAEVKVDLDSLGMKVDETTRRVLDEEGGSSVKIFYNNRGKVLNIKIVGVIPTHCGFDLPTLSSFVAMYHETQLWKHWHPIVVGNGPAELWPRRKCHNLWQTSFRLLMQSTADIVEQRFFFIRDRGIFAMSLDGKSPRDELWAQYPPAKGYKPMPGRNDVKLVIAAQKLTSAFNMTASVEGEVVIPGFIARFIVGWLVPEIVRRMMRAGASCLTSDGPHSVATRMDAEGVYKECVGLTERGAELDDLEGRPIFRPGAMPTVEELMGPRASLAAFDRECAKAKSVAGESSLDATAAASTLAPATPVDERGWDASASPLAEGLEEEEILMADLSGRGHFVASHPAELPPSNDRPTDWRECEDVAVAPCCFCSGAVGGAASAPL